MSGWGMNGPAQFFPHPQKTKGYMCIRDRVRLAVFFQDNYNLPYAQQFSPTR